MGIRVQLALLVPAVVALSLFGLAFAAAERARHGEIQEMRERNQRVLESIGVPVALYIAQNDMAGLDTLVAQLSIDAHYPDLAELAVLDMEGRVIAHSTPEHFNSLPTDPFSARAISSPGSVWQLDGSVISIAVPARSGIRWGTVMARFSLQRVERAIARTRAQLLVVSAMVAAAMALLLAFGLDRLVVGPLRELQRVARQMGEGQLDTRAPKLTGRELNELADSFNRMAAALKEEREGLERAVAERTRELSEANERLERLAVTDGLTGVFNHRRFQESLAQEILRANRTEQPLSVLMLDVDHFKKFNDSFGHPAGDELLRKLASTMAAELRATDLLARYGGEEFAVLLPDTGKDMAAQAAERLRVAVEQNLRSDVPGGSVTISAGVATWKVDGTTGQELLTAADRALYQAKHRGRNRVAIAEAA